MPSVLLFCYLLQWHLHKCGWFTNTIWGQHCRIFSTFLVPSAYRYPCKYVMLYVRQSMLSMLKKYSRQLLWSTQSFHLFCFFSECQWTASTMYVHMCGNVCFIEPLRWLCVWCVRQVSVDSDCSSTLGRGWRCPHTPAGDHRSKTAWGPESTGSNRS